MDVRLQALESLIRERLGETEPLERVIIFHCAIVYPGRYLCAQEIPVVAFFATTSVHAMLGFLGGETPLQLDEIVSFPESAQAKTLKALLHFMYLQPQPDIQSLRVRIDQFASFG